MERDEFIRTLKNSRFFNEITDRNGDKSFLSARSIGHIYSLDEEKDGCLIFSADNPNVQITFRYSNGAVHSIRVHHLLPLEAYFGGNYFLEGNETRLFGKIYYSDILSIVSIGFQEV